MTDKDRKLHRGQLLVQIEDAEDDLGGLRGQAISAARSLEEVADKLRQNAALEPSPTDFTIEGDVNNRFTPNEVATFAAIDSLAKLIEAMKRARQDVFNLRRLRRA